MIARKMLPAEMEAGRNLERELACRNHKSATKDRGEVLRKQQRTLPSVGL